MCVYIYIYMEPLRMETRRTIHERCGKAELCFWGGFPVVLTRFTGISPEFHRNFTRTHRNSPDFHQNIGLEHLRFVVSGIAMTCYIIRRV